MMKYPIGIQIFDQIVEEGYAAPYAADRRRLFKIGVNFSSVTRTAEEWKNGRMEEWKIG